MKKFISSVTGFIREEDGATAVEYGILVAAIAAVIVAVTFIIGGQISTAFQSVCNAIAAGGGAPCT